MADKIVSFPGQQIGADLDDVGIRDAYRRLAGIERGLSAEEEASLRRTLLYSGYSPESIEQAVDWRYTLDALVKSVTNFSRGGLGDYALETAITSAVLSAQSEGALGEFISLLEEFSKRMDSQTWEADRRSIKDLLDKFDVNMGQIVRLPADVPESAVFQGGRGRKASDHLKEHWGFYLNAGVLYQHYLARLDPKLKQALDNEFKGRRDELRKLIPTKDDETERLLASVGLADVEPPARWQIAAGLRKARGLEP